MSHHLGLELRKFLLFHQAQICDALISEKAPTLRLRLDDSTDPVYVTAVGQPGQIVLDIRCADYRLEINRLYFDRLLAPTSKSALEALPPTPTETVVRNIFPPISEEPNQLTKTTSLVEALQELTENDILDAVSAV